jgi:hypothetical protein
MSDQKSEGTQKWDAMSEDQKKSTFDKMPAEQKKGLTYTEWIKEGYQHQYTNWMPWIEDQYLKWFTKDNKASYATKGMHNHQSIFSRGPWTQLIGTTWSDTLDKTKVTGIDQVDTLQDGVNNTVGQQVGTGGLLQPIGDMASKEGVNRAERGGKDDKGTFGGPMASATDPVAEKATAGGEGLAEGAKSTGEGITGGLSGAGSSVTEGAKSAAGAISNPFGSAK